MRSVFNIFLISLPILGISSVIYAEEGVMAPFDTVHAMNMDPRLQELGDQILERNRRRGLADPNVLTNEDRQILLDLHNEIRRETANGRYDGPTPSKQPSGCDMNELSWSIALEKLATAYAGICLFQHDSGRNSKLASYQTDAEWEYETSNQVGENLYISGASPSMNMISGDTNYGLLGGIGDSWSAGESKDYNYATGSCMGVCGHYTQVVWAKTRYVGCGFMACNGIANGYNWGKTNLVCNYYPPGNWAGEKPYTQGQPCQCCEADRTVCSNGLCGGGWSSKFNVRGASDTEKRTVDRCFDGTGRNKCTGGSSPVPDPRTALPTRSPSESPTDRPTDAPTPSPVPAGRIVTLGPTPDTRDGRTHYAVQVSIDLTWYTYDYDYGPVTAKIEEFMFHQLTEGKIGITMSVDGSQKTKYGPVCARPVCYYLWGNDKIPMVLQNVGSGDKALIEADVASGDFAARVCQDVTDYFVTTMNNYRGLRCDPGMVSATTSSLTSEAFIGDTNNDGVPFDTMNLESYDGADIFALIIILLMICGCCWICGWYCHKRRFAKDLQKELLDAQNYNVQEREQTLRRQIAANDRPDMLEQGINKIYKK